MLVIGNCNILVNLLFRKTCSNHGTLPETDYQELMAVCAGCSCVRRG